MTLPLPGATYNVIYATEDDWDVNLYGAVPTNVTRLLRSASMLVREATAGAYYLTDDDTALPTDTVIIAAFRDATLTQAAAWSALGYDPISGGVITNGAVTSKSLDGASITYSDAAQAAAARVAAIDNLVPEARRILAAEGLTQLRVWTYG